MLFSSRQISVGIITLLSCSYACQSIASVTLSNSRIVFSSAKKTQEVQLTNNSEAARLVQLWVSDYESQENNDQIDKSPFFISPPVFKLAPKAEQRTRLTFFGNDLPKDRESLYWFHYLEIPPVSAIQTPVQMAISVQNKVKLFYRPTSIKHNIEDLPSLLNFNMKSNVLFIENPTGYYVNFGRKEITIDGKPMIINKDKLVMIKPFSSYEVKLPNGQAYSNGAVEFTLINDFGGLVKHQTTLSAK